MEEYHRAVTNGRLKGNRGVGRTRQTSNMELFAKIVKPLTQFAKKLNLRFLTDSNCLPGGVSTNLTFKFNSDFRKVFKGIVKRAEPCKCDILLVSRIL